MLFIGYLRKQCKAGRVRVNRNIQSIHDSSANMELNYRHNDVKKVEPDEKCELVIENAGFNCDKDSNNDIMSIRPSPDPSPSSIPPHGIAISNPLFQECTQSHASCYNSPVAKDTEEKF